MRRISQTTLVLLVLLLVSFSCSAWGKTVTLSWDASPSSVTGYKIYYDTSPLDGAGSTEGNSSLDVGNVLTFTVNDLPDTADHYFAVTAYDGAGNESTYSNVVHSAPISAINTAPVLAAIGNKSILEGASLGFTVSASDSDGDSLTFNASGLPAGAGFNGSTGLFSWTPVSDQSGQYTVTISVSDGTASDSEVIQITVADVAVNQAPVLAAIGNKAVDEGDTQYIPVSATDPDGDSLTYSVGSLPSGATFDPVNKIFSWPPTFEQAGVYTVSFTVSDGSLTDSEQISITVRDTNRVPVLNTIGTKTVGEGAPLTFTISASDPDSDALTYRAEALPVGAEFNSSTRQFSWIPDYQDSENTRVYPVSFIVSDGVLEDSETITINVVNVNRAPVLATIGTQSLAEGDSFNLVISASDPDSNSLIYTATGLPEGAVFTPSTRSFSWIPGNNQAGTYQVGFSVTDGSLSDSETITLTVINGNEAPVLAAIGNKSIDEGQPLEIVVSATDGSAGSLTYSVTSLPTGATFNSSERRFSWTPDYSQSGNFNVEFVVSDGVYSDSETISIAVSNTNRVPEISGNPASTVMATATFSFAPTTVDPDGDNLTFTVENQPSWAAFSSEDGRLSGVPDDSHVGTFSNIKINVSDGQVTASLSPFAITVSSYVQLDSDGDGVYDHLDAFPNDPNESVDTDGDQVGNNSDSDDDNDGVADIRDGFPLDASKASWVITATVGAGGYLSPEGETAILFGGSQQYELTPKAGYYVNDLLVDDVSVGLVNHYVFENVGAHHTVEAIFAPIPNGLSYDSLSQGLVGVERVDGNDDSHNLVDGKPKQNLDYRFEVVLRDSVQADQRKVFLVLNGYKYPMTLTSGTLNNGADFTFETRLGPAASHRFYFVAEDSSENQLWRYPNSGDLNGPVVELLNGRNVLGLAADINAYALDATEAFDQKSVYRWIADSGPNGSFEMVDSGAPVSSGEGYVLKKTVGGTLPDRSAYGEVTASVYEMQMKEGWNLISNPYGGHISLKNIKVRRGNNLSQTWLEAVESKLVIDVIYSYLGEDWGGENEFSSASGDNPAVLVPWIGYWIYVNPNAETISLLLSKPLQ
jgi:Putative Ig domain